MQFGPENSDVHIHSYLPFGRSKHVAPLRHGDELHAKFNKIVTYLNLLKLPLNDAMLQNSPS
jgi:hypothetical protein